MYSLLLLYSIQCSLLYASALSLISLLFLLLFTIYSTKYQSYFFVASNISNKRLGCFPTFSPAISLFQLFARHRVVFCSKSFNFFRSIDLWKIRHHRPFKLLWQVLPEPIVLPLWLLLAKITTKSGVLASDWWISVQSQPMPTLHTPPRAATLARSSRFSYHFTALAPMVKSPPSMPPSNSTHGGRSSCAWASCTMAWPPGKVRAPHVPDHLHLSICHMSLRVLATSVLALCHASSHPPRQ